jgi:hypothetical protein
MLKFTKIAEIGDTIRAYDFKPMMGREDCYVEGKVITKGALDCGYDAYCIKVTKDFFGEDVPRDAKGSRVDKLVYVPMQVSFMEYDARIINLTR